MRATVLAIDDSPTIHALLAVRLQPEDLLLLHELTASEGLAKVRELKPDLVLLDIDMPDISGFEICRQLKADSHTAAIPVIFLTGQGDVAAKVRGFDLGAIDYVTKPFEPEELRARVRAALRTKRYQDLLATRAQVDALTGMYNRTYFDSRLDEEIAAARRYHRRVSLVMTDIDHFKRLNDGFGHPFGDKVLQDIGEVMTTTLRATDAPCRYGGEEFALILSETGIEAACNAAGLLRARIAALQFKQKGALVVVTASFGVASTETYSDPSILEPRMLIEAADSALYRAKQAGRNRVCTAPET